MRRLPPLLPAGRGAVVFDVGLAAWMTGFSQYFVTYFPDPDHLWRDIDPLGRILLAAVHIPLAVRRRSPRAVLAAVCAADVAYLALGYYHSMTTFGVALALYTVAAQYPPRVSVKAVVVVAAIHLYASRLAEPGLKLAGAAIAIMISLLAWAFGDGTRRLADRGERLKVLTEQLRREQEARAREAVVEEQGRIARELHDVVAHHMSVISVQAGLGRYVFDSDPDTARDALRVIAGNARDALGEMRRMLAVLRVSAEAAAPFDAAAGLASLGDLLDRVRSAGATVEQTVTGTPKPLTPGIDLCVYRVIQESLTNVLKHAHPPHATVAMDWRADTLTVQVADDGGVPVFPLSNGHGLIGMRERAKIYGGTLAAGPRARGGFEVTLTLPTGDSTS